jgi:hypothetical protein
MGTFINVLEIIVLILLIIFLFSGIRIFKMIETQYLRGDKDRKQPISQK